MRNSVMLIGRPTKPMAQEYKMATFKLIVRENNDSQKHYRFDCVAYGTAAKRVLSKVEEGMQIAIDGSLRNFDYEDRQGHTHTHTEIVVNDLFLIDKPKEV